MLKLLLGMNNLVKASMLKLDFLVEDGWMQSISNQLLNAVQKNTTNLFFYCY
jgi:folate-dependent phosphoribosylglycinamide formyltransferase PurN